jgi:hypothetical protein
MSGFTSHESQILLARAIVEIIDGTPGLGVAHARSLVRLADAGMTYDPSQLPRPPASATKALDRHNAIVTNETMGRPPGQPPPMPVSPPGTTTNTDFDEKLARASKAAEVKGGG